MNEPTAAEGDVGSEGVITFTVSYTGPPLVGTDTYTVDYHGDGPRGGVYPEFTALPGADFDPAFEDFLSFTFVEGGPTSFDVTVPLVADDVPEPTEAFGLHVSPEDAPAFHAVATIHDDDSASIAADVTVAEGDAPGVTADFTVTYDGGDLASGESKTFNVRTVDDTALDGEDFTGGTFPVTFTGPATAGATMPVSIDIISDTQAEPDEMFTLELHSGVPDSSTLLDTATGTITNEDGVPPEFSIADVSVAEGATTDITVTLSESSLLDTSVRVTSSDGTATAGDDYTAIDEVVTVTAGDTSTTVSLTTTGDTTDEFDETLTLTLSEPNNATILTDPDAEITIIDDDAPPTVSVVDATPITEGDAGDYFIQVFDVVLSAPSGKPVDFSYETVAGSAASGTDFDPAAGSKTFAPGETSKTGGIGIFGDDVFEADESYTYELTSATNATIADGSGLGVIEDNDGLTISIDDVTVAEDVLGGTADFTVTLSNPSQTETTVEFTTKDGVGTDKAVAGEDYVAQSGTLTFAPGDTEETISVAIINDVAADFPIEKYTVELSAAASTPPGVSITKSTGAGEIVDDETPPEISIDDVTVAEEDGTATFTVSLSGASNEVVTVDVATADGTATAGVDYTAVSIVDLTFPVGMTEKTVVVPITSDTLREADETFTVTLTDPEAATLGDDTGLGTIENDDSIGVSIDDVTLAEGDAGTTTFDFTVTLDATHTDTITVDWATADDTALAGEDYVADSGTVTFVSGDTAETISITVNTDTIAELDELFFVDISTTELLVNVTDAQGDGTIVNDDTGNVPAASIDDVMMAEGDSGTTTFEFTVSLTEGNALTQTVDWTTVVLAGEANDEDGFIDFSETFGTVVFGPGVTEATISIDVTGDTIFENDEVFEVMLSNPINAELAVDDTGTGTIENDDAMPTLTLIGGSGLEGDSGISDGDGSLVQSNLSEEPASFSLGFADGTAESGSDFDPLDGPAASPSVYFLGPFEDRTDLGFPFARIFGDDIYEADEDFTLELTPLDGLTDIGVTQVATYTILNDDPMPAVSIGDASILEGDTGSLILSFPVTLTNPAQDDITVLFDTADITATAGADYTALIDEPVTFTGGSVSETLDVEILGDLLSEPDETFFVGVSGTTGPVTVADGSADGTIIDNDKPDVFIADAVVDEGDDGDANELEFVVTLSEPSDFDVTVDYTTSDDPSEAVAGADYTTTSGTLTFLAGSTAESIFVPVTGEDIFEDDETLTVTLSNPTEAIIVDGTGSGTITNDDMMPAVSIGDATEFEGNSGTTVFSFPVTLTNPHEDATSVEFETRDGTAEAGLDYTADAGFVFFAPLETATTLEISVTGETVFETDENFFVDLVDSDSLAPGIDLEGEGIIINDDTAPVISIGAASANEGNAGPAALMMPVTLSNPSQTAIDVTVNTSNILDEAVAGSDYTAIVGGTLSIPAYTTAKTVDVAMIGDTTFEDDEDLTVTLSAPTQGTLGTASATGTILNDDALPMLSIDDVSIVEGDTGQKILTFTVSTPNPSENEASALISTSDGTATEGVDYRGSTIRRAIAPGATSTVFEVTIFGDTIFESDETFNATMTAPAGATLGDDVGQGTIVDDDDDRTPNERFVEWLLVHFLRRDVEAGDPLVAEYLAQLEDGASRKSVATAVAFSDEYLGAVVEFIYDQALGRKPDASGRATWIRELRNGATPAELAARIFASTENFQKNGGTNEDWIKGLYRVLLLREADAAGLRNWVAATESIGRRAVAAKFYASVESRQTRVKALYNLLLGRNPDASGLQTWTKVLKNGRDVELAIELAKSTEYFQRAQRIDARLVD